MKVPKTTTEHNPRRDGETPFLWTHPQNSDLTKLIPESPYYMRVATIIRYHFVKHKDTIAKCIDAVSKVSAQIIVVADPRGGRGLPSLANNVTVVAGATHGQGQAVINPDIPWILFLDGDEIVNPESFSQFLNDPDTYDYSLYGFNRVPSILIRKEFAHMNPSLSQQHDCRFQLHLCTYCSDFLSKRGALYDTQFFGEDMITIGDK